MNYLIFCTRTGVLTLPPMIESLQHVKALSEQWQIVAVDNGSADGSRALLQAAATHLPLRIIPGKDGGKNQGLNLALDSLSPELAQAELVVFTDDDILAAPHWLTAMIDGARAHPQASMFGGAILPRWPASPPQWLKTLDGVFDVLYARTHAIDGPCAAHHLYGPNMAIRGPVLARGHRFDPRIGPSRSSTYRMGSETEFVQRLERNGWQAAFLSAAQVHHQVRPEQMTDAFVLARARRHGLGQGVFAARSDQGGRYLPPASYLGRLLASEFKSLLVHLPPLRARRIKVLYGRQWLRGFCQGYVEQCTSTRREEPTGQKARIQP